MGMAMGRLLDLSQLSLNLRQLLGWKQEVQIVVMGHRSAGKTTIINRLQLGKVIETTLTLGFNVEKFEYDNISFVAFDVGHQGTFRTLSGLLRYFFHGTQGCIFVVDSSDRELLPYARDQLKMILNEEQASNATILVFANKQDLPNAMPAEEIAEELGLNSLSDGRRWHIQSCSAISGEGICEGMDWLCNNISTKVSSLWCAGLRN